MGRADVDGERTASRSAHHRRHSGVRRQGLVARALWISLGSLSLGLGIIGIVLPLMPTTPFLLLAAYCFDRGSPRLHRWLLGNRYLGGFIRDYVEGRGIPMRTKAVAIATLWVTMLLTIVLVLGDPGDNVGSVPIWLVDSFLLVIAAGVTLHLVTLPTAPARPRRIV